MKFTIKRPVSTPDSVVISPLALKPFSHESMYAFWTRHAIANGNDLPDLKDFEKISKRSLFVGLIDPIGDKKILVDFLGISSGKVGHLCGDDIFADQGRGLLRHNGLRYCSKCMEFGYHSELYQHLAISRCPLHDIPLEIYCRNCGKLISLTFRSALSNPFECPNCNDSLSRTVTRFSDAGDALLADELAGARRAPLCRLRPLGATVRYFLQESQIQHTRKQVSLSRVVQRMLVWEHPSDSHWNRFKCEKLILLPEHTRGEFHDKESLDLGLAAERVIIWLRRNMTKHELAAIHLANRLGRRPEGLRLNSSTTVVSAAYFKLLVAYDLVQEGAILFDRKADDLYEKALVCYGRSVQRYGDGAPEFPKLNYRLLQLEILGLFAKLLVEYRNERPLCGVSWIQLPQSVEFVPSWSTQRRGEEVHVDIRPRATETSVLRLMKRRDKAHLSYLARDPVGADGLWRHNQLNGTWYEPF
jgi:hypothetical protein